MAPCKPSSLHLGRRGVHAPAPPTLLAEPGCVCPVPSVRSLAEHLLGVGPVLAPIWTASSIRKAESYPVPGSQLDPKEELGDIKIKGKKLIAVEHLLCSMSSLVVILTKESPVSIIILILPRRTVEHQWGENSSRFQREKPNSKQIQQERGFRGKILGSSQKSEELHESWWLETWSLDGGMCVPGTHLALPHPSGFLIACTLSPLYLTALAFCAGLWFIQVGVCACSVDPSWWKHYWHVGGASGMRRAIFQGCVCLCTHVCVLGIVKRKERRARLTKATNVTTCVQRYL